MLCRCETMPPASHRGVGRRRDDPHRGAAAGGAPPAPATGGGGALVPLVPLLLLCDPATNAPSPLGTTLDVALVARARTRARALAVDEAWRADSSIHPSGVCRQLWQRLQYTNLMRHVMLL